MAQWKRAGLITRRTLDRNQSLLENFLFLLLLISIKIRDIVSYHPDQFGNGVILAFFTLGNVSVSMSKFALEQGSTDYIDAHESQE